MWQPQHPAVIVLFPAGDEKRKETVWRCSSASGGVWVSKKGWSWERFIVVSTIMGVNDCVAFEAGLASAWHADEGGVMAIAVAICCAMTQPTMCARWD
jgi:hypothetical protein